jgi:dephospho-CoA kinase
VSTLQRRWILCGGLASGKSVVRRLLEERGVRAIDADSIGHDVLEPGGPAFAEVAATWPSVVVAGRIDRGALAGIVFEDADELRRLEAITHPHIFERIESEIGADDGVVVVEMPVLSELGAGWRRMVVDARDEVRVSRALDRGMDEADARARMARQPSRSRWLATADLVVPNHGAEHELRRAVTKLVPVLLG